ncbi:MAG: transglutaminase domain-containing protein, partial [Ilumatobacteraceae bacterium]
VWGLPEQDLEAPDGGLLAAPATAGGARDNRQRVTIVDLGGSLVPAAPEPYQASGPDDLRWVTHSSTLVTVDGDLEDGDVIDIVSAAPRVTPALLAAATSSASGSDIYTAVPDDLPDVVATTAAEVTAGTQSTYQAALALQEWFQNEFTYSLEVQSGHGNNAIETFLRDRIGYCEQFAGTYAAMMRTLGYPARVAVGFTSGTTIGAGVYSVLGRNAHAWPEVWFDDIGWVAFEPTPGRGAPNAEEYTGRAPQQDATLPEDPTAVPADAATPTTTIARSIDDGPTPLNIPDEFGDVPNDATTTPTETGSGVDPAPFLAALTVLLLLLAPALVRRLRSRAVGGSAETRLGRLWAHSLDSVRSAGVPVSPSDTPLEVAAITGRHLPVVARPMTELANAVTEATYRSEGAQGYDTVGHYGSSTMRRCHNWSRQVTRAVNESTTIGARVRRYFTVYP